MLEPRQPDATEWIFIIAIIALFIVVVVAQLAH